MNDKVIDEAKATEIIEAYKTVFGDLEERIWELEIGKIEFDTNASLYDKLVFFEESRRMAMLVFLRDSISYLQGERITEQIARKSQQATGV